MPLDYAEMAQAILSAWRSLEEGKAAPAPRLGMFPVAISGKTEASGWRAWLGLPHRARDQVVLGLSPGQRPRSEAVTCFARLTGSSRGERFSLAGFLDEESFPVLAMHLPLEEMEPARLAAHLERLEELLEEELLAEIAPSGSAGAQQEPARAENFEAGRNLDFMSQGWSRV